MPVHVVGIGFSRVLMLLVMTLVVPLGSLIIVTRIGSSMSAVTGQSGPGANSCSSRRGRR